MPVQKQLQFELLFHNTFGRPPADADYTIEFADGDYRAVKNGHTVTLETIGENAVGWRVDGVHLLPFKLYGRRDPAAENNFTRLEHRVSQAAGEQSGGGGSGTEGNGQSPPVQIRGG